MDKSRAEPTIQDRLRHMEQNCGDQYTGEVCNRAAAKIDDQQAEIENYKRGVDILKTTQAENKALRERMAELKKKYNELIYAVATKYPDKSRHETALYYIQQAENCDSGPPEQALQGEGK